MKLNELAPAPGAVKKRKRVGRGSGSGHGKRSCRGDKGQRARSKVHRWFEGGQMPLQRRLPKRGFKPLNRKEYEIVSLKAIGERFGEGDEVNPEALMAKNLVKKSDAKIKILASEGLSFGVKITAHAISAKAREMVEKSGGTVNLIERK
ncbi:MAG: 50S ribosomal protein L15 [Candidatus Eisenbacteria bacterium]